MKIQFHPLFSLAVNHSYYPGACSDFEFAASPSTAELLRRGRLQLRTLNGKLHVWFESDFSGSPIINLQGSELVFALRLTNASFSHFTKPVLNDLSLLPFYTNGTQANALDDPFGVVLTSGIYPHVTQSTDRPLSCTLRTLDGAIIREDVLRSNEPAFAFDLRQIPNGRYSVVEQTSDGSQFQRQLYVNTELRSTSAWGVVSIRIDSSFYATPPTFSLNFQAREEQYKYYLVARNFSASKFNALTTDFQVIDSVPKDDPRPAILFDKITSDKFGPADMSRALLGDDSDLILMFRSKVAIARRASGYQKFMLKKDQEVLFDNLPQPGADLPLAQFIVHVSKLQGLIP